jgi:hypothetical protein
MDDKCPCCGAPLKIDISKHALERLDERAYIKYFRNFRAGEDKRKWLTRVTLEAIENGTRCNPDEAGVTLYWNKGVMFVFGTKKDRLVLVTLYPKSSARTARREQLPWEERKLYREVFSVQTLGTPTIQTESADE